MERLRLSSVEPMDFTDDLLGLMTATPRISKHGHAPLQSGSDTICDACTVNTGPAIMLIASFRRAA